MTAGDYDLLLNIDFYAEFFGACEAGKCNYISDLIKLVPDINHRDRKGWTALIKAAYSGKLDVMKILLEHQASPNNTNFKGTTCLMYALSYFERSLGNDTRPFNLLLQAGADPQIKDESGLNTADYAHKLITICSQS